MIPAKVFFTFGTRPEAIKLCPVIRAFQEAGSAFKVTVCVTAQHRDMLDQVLDVFSVTPDYDLNAMQPGQTLSAMTGRIVAELEPVLSVERPDIVVVQGDTTTTLCGALAGFYAGIPVAHVEAGLRTGDLRQPFPEEMNRVVVGRLATLHFASVPRAAENLRAEGVPDSAIAVTGNTGIDALLYIRDRLERKLVPAPEWPWLEPASRLVLVTAHRRESFGEPLENICEAILRIAAIEGVQVAFPVHPNPRVTEPVHRRLRSHPNIELLSPLDYVSFVDLARRAYLLITDSGGIQEEAPSLGKPVLVLRDKTERSEAVEAGTAVLAGTKADVIAEAAATLLKDGVQYQRMRTAQNPFGDGGASNRIVDAIHRYVLDRK